jgi:hypothetical protein
MRDGANMAQRAADLLVNTAHSWKFHELGRAARERWKVSKMEQRQGTECDRLAIERRGQDNRAVCP